jgi:hypothetical protein
MEVTLFLEMTLTPRSGHPSNFYRDAKEFNYYKNLTIKTLNFNDMNTAEKWLLT